MKKHFDLAQRRILVSFSVERCGKGSRIEQYCGQTFQKKDLLSVVQILKNGFLNSSWRYFLKKIT